MILFCFIRLAYFDCFVHYYFDAADTTSVFSKDYLGEEMDRNNNSETEHQYYPCNCVQNRIQKSLHPN